MRTAQTMSLERCHAIVVEWYGAESINRIALKHGVGNKTVRRIWANAVSTGALPRTPRPLQKHAHKRGRMRGVASDAPLIRVPKGYPLLARLAGGAR